MTLTNIQIISLAQKYNIPNFDCLMNNELPTNTKIQNVNYVVNLENDNLTGSHWCAIIIKNGKALYADSFGCIPTIEVCKFLNNNFMFNTRIIQDLHSDNCGLFALGLIIFCNQYQGDLYDGANKYYNLFNPTNLKQNDKIIKNLFKNK